LLAALALAAVGCDQGREAPPDTVVRVVNVAPGFPSLYFRREQIPGDTGQELGFKNGVERSWDEDTYDFFIFVRDLASNTLQQHRTFVKHVQAGTLYTFVLAQVGSAVQELILEVTPPASNATDGQVVGAHAAEGTPPVDVYVEKTGTDIAGAQPWGANVAFLGTIAPRNLASGDYEITLTPAGNRATVLYRSQSFVVNAATSTARVITPNGGDSTVPLSVTLAQSTFAELVDPSAVPQMRVINAATDGAPRDLALAGQFSPPAFSAVPFATPTPYQPIAAGTDVPVQVTPPGNPGVLELDQKISPTAARLYTLMFSGDAGALTQVFRADDVRPIIGEAKISFYNAAPQFDALDLVIVSAGVDPNSVSGVATLAPGNVGVYQPAVPESYNAYLRKSLTTDIVAGPFPVTFAAGGIYGVLATNGPDTATATITFFQENP
jgi:hypothetical protein